MAWSLALDTPSSLVGASSCATGCAMSREKAGVAGELAGGAGGACACVAILGDTAQSGHVSGNRNSRTAPSHAPSGTVTSTLPPSGVPTVSLSPGVTPLGTSTSKR